MSKNPWIQQVNRMGFRQLLVITFSIGIVLLALISAWVTSTLSAKSLKERLEQEGFNLASTYAESSLNATLYQSEDDAREPTSSIAAFPDVSSAAVFDDEHSLIYGIGNVEQWQGKKVSFPELGSQNLTIKESEDENYWTFITVIYPGAQQDSTYVSLTDLEEEEDVEFIGYTRLEVSKASLHQMQSEILSYNIMVSVALAGALLGILLIITGWITKPLNNLSRVMERAQSGEQEVRAKIEGTREITLMEQAFNSMMNVLESREKDLMVTRDLALEAARVKGEFAANVSHELRTPLNGVLGMLELLQDMGLNTKQSDYVETASNSAESLLVLIDDILDFSKIDSGKMALDQVDFDLTSLMEEAVSLVTTQAQRKNIDLAYCIHPDTPTLLRGDDKRIRQVLLNLLGNAVKFTERGEVGINITVVESSAQQVVLKFEVTDTGIGLAEEVQEKVFEAFSQADGSTTRKYGGTGLGLALCRQIVQLLQGEIGVISTKGEGSNFWFTVNLALVDVKISPEVKTFDSNIKVVVVEDSPVVSQSLSSFLTRLEVKHQVFSSGLKALSFLRSNTDQYKPETSLVLVDELLKDINASELTHLIAKDKDLFRLKVVTLVNRPQTRHNGSSEDKTQFSLSKPVSLHSLRTLLTELSSLPASNESEPKKQLLPDSSVVSFDGSKILIVEDNHANQLVASGMLERLNCKFQIANNGAEALQMVCREHFDLVLMDCHMPEMDGYEATAQIRQLESGSQNITIIAMTANVQKGESDKCLAVGMNGYLPKPLKLDSLRTALSQWLTPKVIPVSARGSSGTDFNRIIDPDVFNDLSNQIGDALPAMVQVFFDDMPNYIRSLKDTVNVRDCSSTADIAHTLKGSASNFGAYRLYDACAKMEEFGRNDQFEQMEALLTTVINESNLLLEALDQHFDNLPRSVSENETDDRAREIDGSNQHILIVDDDRGIRFAMRKILEEEGYLVDEAANGEQALMFCERLMPDLILMDAIMPEMDGFKACAEIQKIPGGKHAPLLIITALNDELSIGRAFAAGATDYISKPVNFAVLRKRIKRLLQASHAEKNVRKLAYHDSLTGLPNRSLFSEQLTEVLKNLGKDDLAALLFLDLDRFKLVNDTYGHDAGDLLLRVVSERLQGCIRKGDMISRFGGDEFTILLRRVNSHESIKGIAEKIYTTLCRPFVFLGKKMHVSCSIGITVAPTDSSDIQALLKNADIAMYRAKSRRTSFEFYDQSMEEDAARRLELESDLQGAIDRNELELLYQPQEDLQTGEIIGMEALIRWNHPQQGSVSPIEFIPLAEETGQIVELGKWVLKTACFQLKDWMDRKHCNLRVAVNISARQLDSGGLAQCAIQILQESGLPARNLELEITESAIMENAESVISILEDLRAQGISLSIDDFGTGYSSLNYLKKFPIQMLKIDGSFISDISAAEADEIVSTIITLAHKMGLKVIAEGVETEEQKSYLISEGCDYIQGYLLGRPYSAADFETHYLD